SQLILIKANFCHRVPCIADVTRSAPKIPTHVGSPLPYIVAAVLAQAINNGTSALAQRISHLLIDSLHFLIGIKIARATPVILQIIDSPGRVRLSVLLLVAVTAFITCARVWPGRGIDS